ncbi:Scarecrow-like protein 9 [Platanthera guangdongensis]|uniref:Scarecrow-like protein 9 n=1 Tax=Platanthera guangdongensis TaxID=2320717 RepID=A0ABR2M0Q0_9ASPA
MWPPGSGWSSREMSPVDVSAGSVENHGAASSSSAEFFSDLVLDYINQMLMEEDMDDQYDMLQTHPDLEATEKPFYDLIGQKYPPSPDRHPLHSASSPERYDFNHTHIASPSQSSADSSNSEDQLSELFSFKILPASQIEKGVEDAKKFLPPADKLTVPFEAEKTGLRQKNRHEDDELFFDESRRSKQSAITYEEPEIPAKMLDDALLCAGEKFPEVVIAIRENIYNEAIQTKNSSNKSSRKKQPPKEEVLDLNTPLVQCAHSVTSGDNRRAHELLRKIREYSSLHGDASERLAHYFADGLEARLAGTGSEIYRSLVEKRKTVGDVLKAYQLYLATCPFKKLSYHFANQTILDAIHNATRVHIIDLGIFFGFQWPVFIEFLSSRPGGPPKLRITGIDNPQAGFHPAERIEETGRRLAEYAGRFGVPFEYHAIAAKFDDLKLEELSLDEDEVLVVNCLFRMHNFTDETVVVDCPRDKMLKAIRELNPAVFVNVIVNGSYGAPFFMTRFREALYHFSAVFDMLDTTAPRESEQRRLVERDLYGRLLINAISCEGLERERPETYKQWQVRCLRVGLEQVPLSSEFLKMAKKKARAYYHKNFNIDADGSWLLQGWKGRILYALSAWKPR